MRFDKPDLATGSSFVILKDEKNGPCLILG